MRRSLFPQITVGGMSPQRVVLTLRDPSEYSDRPGYDAAFLDPLPAVPMPALPADWKRDRVPVADPARPNARTHELKYQHFSTVHRTSRRMPFFSCVNVDGAQSKSVARTDEWRYDPRIPSKHQIITDGIYGNAGDGLFSRGHMTRREDPNWGSKRTAAIADADTFHVTNACPQFQTFNSPIWLGLESYVLGNAREDDMRISVFTGPVFDDRRDPMYAPPGFPKVQVPVQFWKIVIFRHDDTRKLACAAYVASQARMLPRRGRPAFVFGEFEDFQLTVRELQSMTRLKFGPLVQADVLAGGSEGLRLRPRALSDLVLR